MKEERCDVGGGEGGVVGGGSVGRGVMKEEGCDVGGGEGGVVIFDHFFM